MSEVRMLKPEEMGLTNIVQTFEDGLRTEKKIVFSGDVGNTNQPIIKDPAPVSEADYLVLESTYGSRNHERHTDAIRII